MGITNEPMVTLTEENAIYDSQSGVIGSNNDISQRYASRERIDADIDDAVGNGNGRQPKGAKWI